MITEKLEDLKIPQLPKLTNGFVVVQEAAWDNLLKYVQAQTDIINTVSESLKNLNELHGLHYKLTTEKLKLVEDELSDIAKALEGAFEDE